VNRLVTLVRSIVSVYRDRDIPFLAGSVAFSAFLSLLPIVLLLLIVASVLGGEAFRQYALNSAEQYLTPSTLGVVDQSLSQAGERIGFSIFGIVALLWTVLRVFRSLDTAFSTLYRASRDSNILEQLRDSVIIFGTMTVAILTAIAVGAVLAFTPDLLPEIETGVPLIRIAISLALIVGLTVVFLPMYYVFPDVDVTVREVVPGAVFAAVGWTLLQGGFRICISMSSAGQLYGVIGGVILFLTWLYFGAVILLLGGALNVVLAGRERSSPDAMSKHRPEIVDSQPFRKSNQGADDG
jgi:membrane protein